LARALEVRGIPSEPDKVKAAVEGDIEAVDGVMRITKIRVHYSVKIPPGKREAAERALATHETKCPAATSVRGCIATEITADITEE
jgi:organic hydroperoxide reductase OsmC/OhrA